MLQSDDRVLLREALRPPEGYELDSAIITTYSLDLLSLLTVPLYFTLFEVEGEDGTTLSDPLALLQALRRYAGAMSVYCQAGEIAVPARQQQLFGYLESSIVEVSSPRKNGVFHPKVWALRYLAPAQPVLYRVACFSRNVTGDRSWDTAVVLEGSLQERKVGYSGNKPLGEFFASLPTMAIRNLPEPAGARATKMADELRRVKFELPEGFDDLIFWPIGHAQKEMWPFKGRADRMLVVSPFLSAGCLKRLTDTCKDVQLVSRLESLDQIENELLDGMSAVSCLADAVETERAEEVVADTTGTLSGLHAKLYVIDHGWQASVLTGSANATNAAYGSNVEFLVELIGKRSVCGVQAILAAEKGRNSLGALLQPYSRSDESVSDEVQRQLEERVDACARAVAKLKLVLSAQLHGDGTYRIEVRHVEEPALDLDPDLELTCWLITQTDGYAVPLQPFEQVLAVIPSASAEALTTFLAVSATGISGTYTHTKRFVLNLPLEGGPPDRRERILRTVLRDRAKVLRFLLLLLGDMDAVLAGDVVLPGEADGYDSGRHGGSTVALLEPLVRALHRDPSRLDQIAKVIEELAGSEDGDLLPEEFESVWEAIWSVRRESLP
ncbi:MAG: hypothetical protein H0T50_13800 [Gemmatimonadales bacterium]|nr:hypothetical protein [Gemmatimonadales bacterium]